MTESGLFAAQGSWSFIHSRGIRFVHGTVPYAKHLLGWQKRISEKGKNEFFCQHRPHCGPATMSTFNAAASRVFSSFAGSPPPQQQSSLASGTASVVGHGSSTTSSAHVSPSPSQQALQSGAVSQGGGGGLDEVTDSCAPPCGGA